MKCQLNLPYKNSCNNLHCLIKYTFLMIQHKRNILVGNQINVGRVNLSSWLVFNNTFIWELFIHWKTMVPYVQLSSKEFPTIILLSYLGPKNSKSIFDCWYQSLKQLLIPSTQFQHLNLYKMNDFFLMFDRLLSPFIIT